MRKNNMHRAFVYLVDNLSSSFVINDIKILANSFDSISIFATQKTEIPNDLPENVKVSQEYLKWERFSPKNVLFRNLFSIFQIYISECFQSKKILKPIPAIALIASNKFKADCLLDALNRNKINYKGAIFYSFWFYDCIYLAMIKRRSRSSTVIVRAHGGDLFEYRVTLQNRILLRHFQLEYIDFLFSVSDAGTNYLQQKYPKHKEKIATSRLGTYNHGLSPFAPNDEFVIVSCAHIRHQKRVHKIAKTLLQCHRRIKWYHIGSENSHPNDPKREEYIYYKELLKKSPNITYIPLGALNNVEVINFYKNNHVDLFVSLSAFEGVPVSIMEAISFGIPVLSTDVGGCNEIVNEQTGQLIPLNTPTAEIASIIERIASSNINTLEFRRGVRAFWQNNFEIEMNYKELFDILEMHPH